MPCFGANNRVKEQYVLGTRTTSHCDPSVNFHSWLCFLLTIMMTCALLSCSAPYYSTCEVCIVWKLCGNAKTTLDSWRVERNAGTGGVWLLDALSWFVRFSKRSQANQALMLWGGETDSSALAWPVSQCAFVSACFFFPLPSPAVILMEHPPEPETNGSLFLGCDVLACTLGSWNPSVLCSCSAFSPLAPQDLINTNAEFPQALQLFLALTLELCEGWMEIYDFV